MVMRHDLTGCTIWTSCALCNLSQQCRTDSEVGNNHNYSFYTRLAASREQNFHIFPAIPIPTVNLLKKLATASSISLEGTKKLAIEREKVVAKRIVYSTIPVKPDPFRVLEFPSVPTSTSTFIFEVKPIVATKIASKEAIEKVNKMSKSVELDDEDFIPFVEKKVSKKVVGAKKPLSKKNKKQEVKKKFETPDEQVGHKKDFGSKKSVDEDDFVPMIPFVKEKKGRKEKVKKRKSAPASTPISNSVLAEIVVKKEVANDDDDVEIVNDKNKNKRRRRIVDDEDWKKGKVGGKIKNNFQNTLILYFLHLLTRLTFKNYPRQTF